MIDEDKIAKELVKREKITFSEFRRDFGLTYQEAKISLDRLVAADLVRYASGMTYYVRKNVGEMKNEGKDAEKDSVQTDFLDQLLEGIVKCNDDQDALFYPIRKRKDSDESKPRNRLLEEVRKMSDELMRERMEKFKKEDERVEKEKEEKEDGEPKSDGKMGVGRKKPQIEIQIAPTKRRQLSHVAKLPPTEDYLHWKEEHRAEEKNFPENEVEIPKLIFTGMKAGVRPDSYKAVTVTGYDGEEYSIELTMREDRKVMWLSIAGRDILRIVNKVRLTHAREIISDYSGVKCLRGSLFVTVHDLKQVMGAIINLCGAYAALKKRADD